MMSLNMESLFNPQRIMDDQLVLIQDFHDHDHDHDIISNSCSSSSSSIKEEEEEENEEEINSSSSSSPTLSTPLQDMSSLLLQLPLKRGLSRHYNGKSQSFTSLSNVRCVEDLAKEENPFNKRLKTCKSYAGFPRKKNHSSSRNKPSNLGSHFSSNFNADFLENTSNNSYYTHNNSSNNMAPIPPPQRSTNTSRLIY